MFYLVGKIAWLLVTPSNALILLALTGIAFLRSRHERWQRRGRALLVTAVAALVIFGLTPLSPFALSILEQRFPPLPASSQIDGIPAWRGTEPLRTRQVPGRTQRLWPETDHGG